MILFLSVFIPMSLPPILPWVAIWAGFYLLLVGFHQLFRKRGGPNAPVTGLESAGAAEADDEESVENEREFHTGEHHLSRSAESRRESGNNYSPASVSRPQIIRLESGPTPASSREMTQQSKIAAALSRVSAAKRPVEIASRAIDGEKRSFLPRLSELQTREAPGIEDHDEIGRGDAPFLAPDYGQKDLVRAPAWKSTAFISAGIASTALGIYMLLQ